MGVEDQETVHADSHHEYQRPDCHSEDAPERELSWKMKEFDVIPPTLFTPFYGWESFIRMAGEADLPIPEKRLVECETIQSSTSPDDEGGNDDASSASQSGGDSNENSDTSTPEYKGHTHTKGSSPTRVLLEIAPEPKPTANELEQCVKLIHCLPCSSPACKSLYHPTLDVSKWKQAESLLYRMITTTEFQYRPPGDRNDMGGLCKPKGMGITRSRSGGGWCGREKAESDGGKEDDGGEGKDDGGGGERKNSFNATTASRDKDKPCDRNITTQPTTILVIGGGKGQTPSAKKPIKYFAASASSIDGVFTGGGGKDSGGEERGGQRGGGKEAGGEGREERGEGGECGRGGDRGEGGNIDIEKPKGKGESSGEVEAVKASSDGTSSDGRGIITHDGKAVPKAEEDSDTTGDSPMKIQPPSPTEKAPEPPPNLHVPPFDTYLLPFIGCAPPTDDPVPFGLDLPPNCETVCYEEGSHLCSKLVCSKFMIGYDDYHSPYRREPSSTVVTGSVEGSYCNTVTGNTFLPITRVQNEELDLVYIPHPVRVALEQCTLPVLLTTEMAIVENALPLKLFLEICVLADVGEHVQALFSSLIDCRKILRSHNIPFAVDTSSVFVDLRHMMVMMPCSFCIIEQTSDEFVIFVLEVMDIVESILKHHPHHCESLRSNIYHMLNDGEPAKCI